MHQVLLIDELLRTIFYQIDSDVNRRPVLRGFAQLARVCKAWKDPALDYLWASLGSLDPLLFLIPGVSKVDDAYTVPDTISPADVANFLTYASRVQSVCQYSRKFVKVPSALLSRILPHCLKDTLFPRLANARFILHDSNKRNIFPPTLYLSPRLTTLAVDISFLSGMPNAAVVNQPGEALCVYLAAVARVAKGLEHLRLRGRVCERMMDTVATLTGLKTLSLCIGSDISAQSLAAISAFPHLEEFRVQLDAMDARALDEALRLANEGNPFFPALQTLHVRSSPSVAEVLFSHLASDTHLHTIRLEADFKPRPVDCWTPVLSLLADKLTHTLADLSLECLTNFCEVPDHAFPPQLHFTLTTLSPLSKLTHLRKFHLDASVPADLGDRDLATLAEWWPHVEDLGLWTRPIDAFDYPTYFTLTPRATPASLAVLAARCPRLRTLALAMDVSALPPPAHPPMVCAALGALQRLTLGCGRTAARPVDPAALAECVYRSFPALGRIDFESGGEAAWGEVLEGYFGLQGTPLRVSVEGTEDN